MVKMTDAEFKVMENLEIIEDVAEMIMSSQTVNVIIANKSQLSNNDVMGNIVYHVEGVKVGMKHLSLSQAIKLKDKDSIVKMLNMALDKDTGVDNCDKRWITSYGELYGKANEIVIMEMGEVETYMGL